MTDDIKSAVEAAKRIKRATAAFPDSSVARIARALLTLASRVEKIEAETLKRSIKAVSFVAWRHEGDDDYSKGMYAGARHQMKACLAALRAALAAEGVSHDR